MRHCIGALSFLGFSYSEIEGFMMQIIDHWPIGSLAINDEVKEALHRYLLEPFEGEGEAQSMWEETSTVFIFIQEGDCESLISHLGDRPCQLIQWAMSFPDDCVTLTPQYELKMGILGDDGSGVFLLIHEQNMLTEYLVNN